MIRRESDKIILKEAIKEAAREWMDEQFAAFGRWTAIGIASGVFGLAVQLLVVHDIWPFKGN